MNQQTVLVFRSHNTASSIDVLRDSILKQLDNDERVKVVVIPGHAEYVTSSWLESDGIS